MSAPREIRSFRIIKNGGDVYPSPSSRDFFFFFVFFAAAKTKGKGKKMVRVKIMFSLILVYHVGDTDFDTPNSTNRKIIREHEPLFLRFHREGEYLFLRRKV